MARLSIQTRISIVEHANQQPGSTIYVNTNKAQAVGEFVASRDLPYAVERTARGVKLTPLSKLKGN